MSFEADRLGHENTLPHPIDTTAGHDPREPSTGGSGPSDDQNRRLEAALYSPFGVGKLLDRLKQSIFSARELSNFLRERALIEDRYAQGYKKLLRSASESIRRPEARQGSYARNFDESLRLNDRLADNGLQFANAMQTMSEQLRDLAENTEKGRKHWKHSAMDAEKKVADAENAQMKARDRYNNVAEQYERAKTGERQSGKFGLKNKSPAQQEEALKEKADMLDHEYGAKTHAAQAERREYDNTHKPQIVRALRDLISECDAHVSMQMARLASLTEKHVVSNGMAIAPLRAPGATGSEPRGLRQIISDIDDRKDFHDYMLDGAEPQTQFRARSRRNTDADPVHTPVQPTQHVDRSKVHDSPYNGNPSHLESEVPQVSRPGGDDNFSTSFEAQRPAVQNLSSFATGKPDIPQQPPSSQSQQTGVTQESTLAPGAGRGKPLEYSPLASNRTQAPHGGFGGLPSMDRYQEPPRQGSMPPTAMYNGRSSLDANQGLPKQDSFGPPTGRGQPAPANPNGPYLGRGGPAPGSYMDPGRNTGTFGAAAGATAAAATVAGRGQHPPATRNLPSQQPPRPTLPPTRPVFGVHLDELFRRDGSAVPVIVLQCIKAVDLLGLNTEGIYRISGSTPTVMQLKSEFDHDSSKVDLTQKDVFNNDISAVATLLKNYLRELPDPLLTATAYPSFIQAAKYEDTIMRRDAMHQYINSLPDPNYATLRVLVLHLHRVAMNSEVNKMDVRNLAIVFGPTVMGGSNMADAGWQTKVMENILHHTHDIFEADEVADE